MMLMKILCNHGLFQVWLERRCCWVWQTAVLRSWASVRGSELFSSLWPDRERPFHVDLEPLSSVFIMTITGAACLSSSPTIDQPCLFFFPLEWKGKLGSFDSLSVPSPQARVTGTLSGPCRLFLLGSFGSDIDDPFYCGLSLWERLRSCCQGSCITMLY